MRDPVYAKTAKGRDEVARRGLGLNGRQRSVLIMLDGQRPCAALADLMPRAAIADIIGELLALDLIAPLAAPPEAAPASIAAPAPALPPEAAARLARAKAEMTRTAEAYLGLLAAEVVRRIERAGDERQLLGVMGHWHMALQASKHGKEVALELVEQVKAGLRADCDKL